jgi:hypothetical protein
MEAIRHVFHTLDPDQMIGTFIGIPVANPLAYAARTRATPSSIDGLNLARVFPGDPEGTLTRRLAHHLLALVERLIGPTISSSISTVVAPEKNALARHLRDLTDVDQSSAEEAARHRSLRLWLIPARPLQRRNCPPRYSHARHRTTGRAGCGPTDVATYTTASQPPAFKRIVPVSHRTASTAPRQTIDLSPPPAASSALRCVSTTSLPARSSANHRRRR